MRSDASAVWPGYIAFFSSTYYIESLMKIEMMKLKYTEKYAKQILSLPIHAFLSDQQVKYVVNNIKLFFNKN